MEEQALQPKREENNSRDKADLTGRKARYVVLM